MLQLNLGIRRKNTAPHLAAGNGHTTIVELLLPKGALIEALGVNHRTHLHPAVGNGQTSTIELLLGKGASIEAMDERQQYPIASCHMEWSSWYRGAASRERCLHH